MNEIRVQMDDMRIAAQVRQLPSCAREDIMAHCICQALKIRQGYDAGPGVGKTSVLDPAHTLMPIHTSSSSADGSSGKSRELSVSVDHLEHQRARQDRCESLLSVQRVIFEAIVQRITGRPYSNTDFEISSVQLPALEECLQIFRDMDSSILLDRNLPLNEYWMEILEMYITTLEAMPQSMLHVHVRDMRYTITGLLDEMYREDPLEFNLVYDLGFQKSSKSARAYSA